MGAAHTGSTSATSCPCREPPALTPSPLALSPASRPLQPPSPPCPPRPAPTCTGAVLASSWWLLILCLRCTTPHMICCMPLDTTLTPAMIRPTVFTVTSVTVLQGRRAGAPGGGRGGVGLGGLGARGTQPHQVAFQERRVPSAAATAAPACAAIAAGAPATGLRPLTQWPRRL